MVSPEDGGGEGKAQFLYRNVGSFEDWKLTCLRLPQGKSMHPLFSPAVGRVLSPCYGSICELDKGEQHYQPPLGASPSPRSFTPIISWPHHHPARQIALSLLCI